MRSRAGIVPMISALLVGPAHAQVINSQSTYDSNLRKRPPVELADSALMPKPQPRRDTDGAKRQTERWRRSS